MKDVRLRRGQTRHVLLKFFFNSSLSGRPVDATKYVINRLVVELEAGCDVEEAQGL